MDMISTAHITQQSIDASNKAPVTETELIGAATGERVTLDQIERTIASEHYFTAAQGDARAIEDLVATGEATEKEALRVVPHDLALLTFCVLRLRNGFTVHGSSACADPVNFDAAIGRRLARTDAINKMWALLGYELKSELAKAYRH